MVCLVLCSANAFAPASPQQRSSRSTVETKPQATHPQRHAITTTSLYAASKKKASSTEKRADFEYQEVKILTQAMKSQNIKPSQLPADKRVELEGYIRRILQQRPSLVPLDRLQDVLPDTKWRLAFSTEQLVSEALPKDATIQLDFKDSTNVDYSLEFDKTLGLKRLVAKSTYTVDASGNPGLVAIQYGSISTDVFGFKGLGVPEFGVLKGRGSYIQTAFYDGSLWIERGTNANGDEFYNVYTLEKDEE
ncbi:MAG: hypothetical protein SGARI_000916 [Bacillariaceae sp.]